MPPANVVSGARLADFPEQVDTAVRRFIQNPQDGLFITGPVGTGKTHLAAAIVRILTESGETVRFCRTSDLYSEARASYQAEFPSEQEILRPYVETPVLVLDDLAGGSLSDHERRLTLDVLDRRWNQMQPTIVTSNWTLEEIGERMDVRISSRLRGCIAIVLGGCDRRAKR